MAKLSKAERLQKLKKDKERIDRELQELEGPEETTKKPKEQVTDDALDERNTDFEPLKRNVEYVLFQPNHQLMGKLELREQDQKRQRLFFYKRLTDDQILCYTEAEAARMMESSHAPVLRQIGVSDGSAYWSYLKNCGVKPGQRITVQRAQELLTAAQNAEMEAARGHYDDPMSQNVHFDATIRKHKNSRAIIQGFSPN